MNVWVDVSNAPHVHFFRNLVEDWAAAGHKVIITARPLSNTIPLLDAYGIGYEIVGRHYGKGIFSKVIGFPIRCVQLWWNLRSFNIDVAISQSSFYSPIVSRLLGCKSVYTNDNEHALGNFIAFLFTDRILLPESLEEWSRGRWFQRKVVFYPGVKEAIYLHKLVMVLDGAEKRIDTDLSIFFRPEPWTAQYHDSDKNAYVSVLKELSKLFYINVLPRGDEQQNFYAQFESEKLKVVRAPIKIDELAKRCCAFIGAGGSMSRELAVIGVPTISVYSGALLEVDRYLIRKRIMVHLEQLSANSVVKVIEQGDHAIRSRRKIYQDGAAAYQVIRESIVL